MPATFPSHAAAVLPLKLWRPRWFDGVALVAGSAAPDAYYALNGLVVVPPTHNLPGLFWFALPVALVATWLVRRAAPIVAAHLPARPARLALHDFGALGRVRHPWFVTVSSALLGSASHLVWDAFTHYPDFPSSWGVRLVPVLATEVPGMDVPWWWLAQQLSTVVGALATVVLLVVVCRRRLLRAWHGPPPAVRRAPLVFWPTAAAVAALYPLTWPYLPYQHANYVQGVRILVAVMLALLAASAATHLATRLLGGTRK